MDTETKKTIIKDTWYLRDTGHVPYLVEVGQHHLATLDFYDDDEKELSWIQTYYKNIPEMEDYSIPNIKPNVGIGLVATAFGCECIPNAEGDPWTKPIITENNISSVYKIGKPSISSMVYRRAFERLGYFLLHSELPLRLLNVPSPLVVASQVWEYTSFVEATIAHPNEVHYLLNVVTDSIIDYVKAQLEIISRLFTMGHEPLYIPRDIGIRISDDTAVVFSPDAYREFGAKYNRRIAEAFGGLIWHSCGDVSAVLPVVMEIPQLRGIDVVAPQNNWVKLRDAAGGRIAMILRHYFWDHAQHGIDAVTYGRDLIDFFGRKGLFLVTSAPTAEEAHGVAKGLGKILI